MANKNYATKEQIERARELTLLEYMRGYEPSELVKNGASEYRLKSNHSLAINAKNSKWFDHATGEGGLSALDFLIKSRGINFVNAVKQLAGYINTVVVAHTISGVQNEGPANKTREEQNPALPETERELILPAQNTDEFGNPDNRRVFAYLKSRGIDPEIINHHIKRGALYEEAERHNAVFVGFKSNSEAGYAAIRGTLTGRRFVGEVSGSDKRYSFSCTGKADVLYIFESAIDAMSAQTLMKLKNNDWREPSVLSLGGSAVPANGDLPAALTEFLVQSERLPKGIIIALDADEPGRDAAARLQNALTERGYNIKIREPNRGKDINDELQYEVQNNHFPKRSATGRDAPER
jgi:hypothetical protein